MFIIRFRIKTNFKLTNFQGTKFPVPKSFYRYLIPWLKVTRLERSTTSSKNHFPTCTQVAVFLFFFFFLFALVSQRQAVEGARRNAVFIVRHSNGWRQPIMKIYNWSPERGEWIIARNARWSRVVFTTTRTGGGAFFSSIKKEKKKK